MRGWWEYSRGSSSLLGRIILEGRDAFFIFSHLKNANIIGYYFDHKGIYKFLVIQLTCNKKARDRDEKGY
ncbi:hypothetical protein GCM10011573_12220 [Enterococcus wangshanyuanii]|uniref:Uncharacterized protein n=1 Tax=Enterococcus wangshanyuanii TaxID=2005703 RepID=A0ABQ1NT46_9ENTE|nr:hypothetical protein GCM10011573_12220 [Enterococcus wangshanyuanii]